MTAGELKKILRDIPDDMEVEIYDGSDMEGSGSITWAKVVQCDDLDCWECGGKGTCFPPKFVIASDLSMI